MKKAIIVLVAVALVSGIALWLSKPKHETPPEEKSNVTDEVSEQVTENGPALPALNDISSIEMIYSKGKYSNGESYICKDKAIIADLVDLMATASLTGEKSTGDTPQADDYFTVNIKGGDDKETLITGYVGFEEPETCFFEISGQGIYSADPDLYFIVGDLVADS